MGDPNCKVLFRVESTDGSCDVETLWAESLGDDRYRLDNSPFYAYSVSWEDVVYAPFDPDQEFPTFKEVLEKSGNRTVRIIFDAPYDEGNQSLVLLENLTAIGCSYEGATKSYISLNIPAATDLSECISMLIDSGCQWEHADPTHSELYPSG